ncbi:transposase domain-containing protein [Saccharopolyspora pogona]|uniref:transposase domain-containing protein n=1 Tax=Saccharopolyspora pogona TaxID=333966 RepID=UPI0037CBDF1C
MLGLCLQRTRSCSSVLRAMIPWDRLARLCGLEWRLPCSRALTKLRDRIGAVPLEVLFARMTEWLPARRAAWSYAFGLRVCAWDGTEIEVADTPSNRHHFGRHRRAGTDSASRRLLAVPTRRPGRRPRLTAQRGPQPQTRPQTAQTPPDQRRDRPGHRSRHHHHHRR